MVGPYVGRLYLKGSWALLRVPKRSLLIDGGTHTALQHRLTSPRFTSQLTRSERDRSFFPLSQRISITAGCCSSARRRGGSCRTCGHSTLGQGEGAQQPGRKRHFTPSLGLSLPLRTQLGRRDQIKAPAVPPTQQISLSERFVLLNPGCSACS